jgi:hypothetical protein
MSVTQIYHIVMDAMQQLRPDEGNRNDSPE